MACPSCGFLNEQDETFCGGCAEPLAPLATSAKQPATASSSPIPKFSKGKQGAERRQLTVMFCDLVGFTLLSRDLDPEELREVVRAYQEVCTETVVRFEGHVAQYLGDGVLVYFGYPAAHEDDAQRAVHAAIGIVEGVRDLNVRLRQDRGVDLAVRLGVHTGPVVVGEVGSRARYELLAMGETPNVASRIQELAEPDGVVISAATHRLVEGRFDCVDFGRHTLKGVATPMQLYRVLGESKTRSRLEAGAKTGLTPYVGREQEVQHLLDRWERAKIGLGQVVLLTGDAGIGKSRVLRLLKERMAVDSHTRLDCHCSALYENSSFYPVVELLHRVLGLSRQDTDEQKLAKLEAGLRPFVPDLSEAAPLYAALLSIPYPGGEPSFSTPYRQKQKTLESLLHVLLTMAAQQPLLLTVEDLQWIDPSTLDLLSLIVDRAATTPLLVVLTSRTDVQVPWAPSAHVSTVALNRLTRTQTELMIKRVAGDKALPDEVLKQLVAKTDGIPLFIEEMTKMVLESGWLSDDGQGYTLKGRPGPLTIPTTLQDSLMARLDRLTTAKEVAQLGATVGREFTYELLHAVSPLDETDLRQELSRLVDAEILFVSGLLPQARYTFKHALIQDAAHQSLLKTRKQQYHEQIAQAMEQRFPEIALTRPEVLAHHYTEAARRERAVAYWQRAGWRALQRAANVEAIEHLTRGLELLKGLPDTPERAQQELALQTSLGPALMATKGYAAPDVEMAYARARQLCREAGNSPEMFRTLAGLWAFYFVRGELQTGRDLAAQLLALAHAGDNPAFLLEGNYSLGQTLWLLGEFGPARTHLEQAIVLYRPQKRRSVVLPDVGVMCLANASYVLWSLGYPEQALVSAHRAVALASELSHPFSAAIAAFYTAWLHQFRREKDAARENAERAIALSKEHGLPFWAAAASLLRGWALSEEGHASGERRHEEQGLLELRQGLASYRSTGARLGVPYYLGLLADAYGRWGEVEQGLKTVDDALVIASEIGERFYEAELYRLRGELTLRSGPPTAASRGPEADFRQALEIARRQGAKSLELRVTMSLARLWQRQGRSELARPMLAEIFATFTEGFETADLRQAKALLDELS